VISVTEAQKKQIIILGSFVLTLLIFIMGIVPLQQTIEDNTAHLAEVQMQREEMQMIVEDQTIEAEYIKLREEYEVKFQQRFENFNINEKVEAITKEFETPIDSMRIEEFSPISTTLYENHIAQPKTMEELEQVRIDESSPIFALLLSARADISLDIKDMDQGLELYDAFNNVVPAGPGDADPDRYCLLVPTMNLKGLRTAGPTAATVDVIRADYTVYVFAMETMDLSTWDEEFEARKQGGTS